MQESHDPNGLIVDQLSSLSFEVNDEFLKELQELYYIDTNPPSGTFTFYLTCHADQGDGHTYRGFLRDISSTKVVVHRNLGYLGVKIVLHSSLYF